MKLRPLSSEARRMTNLLKGKVVKICRRYKPNEVLVEFKCGSRLFLDAQGELEVSITVNEGGQRERNKRTARKRGKG